MTTSSTDPDRTPPQPLLAGPAVGARIRAARTGAGLTLRELARRVGVSPSFISQLENDKVNASVGTLYALVTCLGLSLDELMTEVEGEEAAPAADTAAPEHPKQPEPPATDAAVVELPAGTTQAASLDHFPTLDWDPESERWPLVTHPVQRAGSRARITFPGVVWERLTHDADPHVDFLNVEYAPGSSSCPDDDMMRHGGHEYGVIVAGRLDVQVGFDTYTLEPGDAITFDSMTPHRLSNPFEEPCQAIWVVVARRADDRAAGLSQPSANVTHLPSLRS
jgi:transcriptional regulator with XRE-family HTH domain/mannose-6-phosphate isomerase-like protein (cupin superfamily)